MDASDWYPPNHQPPIRRAPDEEVDRWARLESRSPSTAEDLRARYTPDNGPARRAARAALIAVAANLLAWCCQSCLSERPTPKPQPPPPATQLAVSRAPR